MDSNAAGIITPVGDPSFRLAVEGAQRRDCVNRHAPSLEEIKADSTSGHTAKAKAGTP